MNESLKDDDTAIYFNGEPIKIECWHKVFKFYTVHLSSFRISVISRKVPLVKAESILQDLYNNHIVDVQYQFLSSEAFTNIEAFTTYDRRWASYLILNITGQNELYLLKIEDAYYSLVTNGVTINVVPFLAMGLLMLVGLALGSFGLYVFVIFVWALNISLANIVEKYVFIQTRVMKQSIQYFHPRSSKVEFFVTQPKLHKCFKSSN